MTKKDTYIVAVIVIFSVPVLLTGLVVFALLLLSQPAGDAAIKAVIAVGVMALMTAISVSVLIRRYLRGDSEAYAEMVDYSDRIVSGKPVMEFDKPTIDDPLRDLKSNLLSIGQELNTLRKTMNQEISRRVSLIQSDANQVAAQNQILKETQAELKKFKLAVDEAPVHIIITDSKGTILYANDASSKITGFSVQEMVGNTTALWGRQMPKDFYAGMWKIIRIDKQIYRGEITNRKKNGQQYEAEIRIAPILDGDNEPLYYVGIESDITLQKQIDRMKSDFISLASHQLRTPLTAIRWNLELLSDDPDHLTSNQSEIIGNMTNSTMRMIDLVRTLLNVSRIESGRLAIVPKPSDLRRMIDSIIAEIKPVFGANRTITADIDPAIGIVEIDEGLLRHVYMNLVTNACKYSPEGTDVHIRVYKKDGFIESEVTDHGYGIPASQQSRIFERFFRADNVLRIKTDGTGLGLYLVRLVVEAGGGKVWFKSSENVGSTFWFTFPETGMKEKLGEVSLE